MNNLIVIETIFLVSLILGLIKYGSIANSYTGKSWQLKFIEIWNDFINFFIAGLIGYYFVLIRGPLLLKGTVLETGDVILLSILLLGLFGHLCVISNNITKGVEAIIEKILKGK